MERIFIYNIPAGSAGKSISCFLREQGYSRHVLISLKKDFGSIVLNEKSALLNTILNENDELKVFYNENVSSKNIVPADIPIDIVYEDEDIVLINKAYNMPIHPSIQHYEDTVANALMYHYRKQNTDFIFRCINRLDTDTTGLILIAKHAISGAILSTDMAKRQIHREYISIVTGMIPPKGRICAPIARKDDSIIERYVDFKNGEYAVTNFERISYKDGYSLVGLKLETGRTHQIRVHMNYIGHPLPGDYLYNPVYDKINRQPLHSHKLSFIHPITGKPMEFVAELPKDFDVFL